MSKWKGLKKYVILNVSSNRKIKIKIEYEKVFIIQKEDNIINYF